MTKKVDDCKMMEVGQHSHVHKIFYLILFIGRHLDGGAVGRHNITKTSREVSDPIILL